MFEEFPDYDVFAPDNKDFNRERKPKKKAVDYDYIEYRESEMPENPPEIQEEEHSTDYGDDFGIVNVYEKRVKNYGTILFFPLTVLWLEILLRLSCNQSLLSFDMVFVVIFSLSFSQIFTVLCSFFSERINRGLSRFFTALLGVAYGIQLVYFVFKGEFLLLSNFQYADLTLGEVDMLMNIMTDKMFYLFGCFAPLIINCFVGKYIFPFRKIPAPGKIALILLAVLLHIAGLILAFVFYKTHYYDEGVTSELQKYFGLYTMGRKDIFELF